jgi:hypothetical protein
VFLFKYIFIPMVAFFPMMVWIAVIGETLPPYDKNGASEWLACMGVIAVLFILHDIRKIRIGSET